MPDAGATSTPLQVTATGSGRPASRSRSSVGAGSDWPVSPAPATFTKRPRVASMSAGAIMNSNIDACPSAGFWWMTISAAGYQRASSRARDWCSWRTNTCTPRSPLSARGSSSWATKGSGS